MGGATGVPTTGLPELSSSPPAEAATAALRPARPDLSSDYFPDIMAGGKPKRGWAKVRARLATSLRPPRASRRPSLGPSTTGAEPTPRGRTLRLSFKRSVSRVVSLRRPRAVKPLSPPRAAWQSSAARIVAGLPRSPHPTNAASPQEGGAWHRV